MTTALRDGELETAEEMSAALVAGEVSSAELVERALSRADAWQVFTNAFSQLWPEEALERAHEIDRGDGSARGEPAREGHEASAPPVGSLRGIPVAVKDLFDVAGKETTGCSAAYRGRVAPVDSPPVAAARRAGLVLTGKTNQHELAAGGTNVVSACGRTGNPWAPRHITGGSSGGSAAAVASGAVPWSLGSDSGGSVRIPAALCGTFGLKPTTGRLSIEGMLPLAPSLDCPGPIAATTRDLARLYLLLAGPGDGVATPLSPKSPPLDNPAFRGGFRLGVLQGFFRENAHPEVLRGVDAVAATLEGAGGEVELVDGRGVEDGRRVWTTLADFEFAASHPGLWERRGILDPETAKWLERGARADPDRVDAATARRREIREWFRGSLRTRDALVLPTTPYPAPEWDQTEVDLDGNGRVRVREVGPGWFTCLVNLAGLPAITIPAARSSAGLPIGVSFVGDDGSEGMLLALAAWWEQVAGYVPRLPPLPGEKGEGVASVLPSGIDLTTET